MLVVAALAMAGIVVRLAVLQVRESGAYAELGSTQRARTEALPAVRGEMAELRGEMAELRAELKGEMAELRVELKGEMAELRGELKGEMAELRGEIGQLDDWFAQKG